MERTTSLCLLDAELNRVQLEVILAYVYPNA